MIEVSNDLEKCLKKYDHTLMFTGALSFEPLNCYEFSADKFDDTGVWELKLNPYIFDYLKNMKAAQRQFKEFSSTPLLAFIGDKSSGFVTFKQDCNNKKDRWKGII